MFRITLSIGIALLASAALLASVAPKEGGRTLGVEEQMRLSGGQSDYCCGVPTQCQLPSPNPSCGQYTTFTQCSGKMYWFNPAGFNIYACVIVVPNAMCTQNIQNNMCIANTSCIWDPQLGCYASQNWVGQAMCPSTCGDMGCT